jgi:hypothetical protein
MAAPMLIHIADEEFVEQVVNVEEHCFVVGSRGHEGLGSDRRRRTHLGLHDRVADGHGKDRHAWVGYCRYGTSIRTRVLTCCVMCWRTLESGLREAAVGKCGEVCGRSVFSVVWMW